MNTDKNPSCYRPLVASVPGRKILLNCIRTLLIAAGFMASVTAHAQSYTATFSGRLSSLTGAAFPGLVAGDGSTTGTPFTFVAYYDSAAASAFNPNGGLVDPLAPSTNYSFTTGSATATVGSFTFSTSSFVVGTTQGNSNNGFGIFNISSLTSSNGVTITNLQVGLTDQSGTFNPVTATTLQNIANNYPLSDFTAVLNITNSGNTEQLQGMITSYSISAIPEPSTYAALAGAAVLGFVAWRRKQQSRELEATAA
jgi:hypothetical protein